MTMLTSFFVDDVDAAEALLADVLSLTFVAVFPLPKRNVEEARGTGRRGQLTFHPTTPLDYFFGCFCSFFLCVCFFLLI